MRIDRYDLVAVVNPDDMNDFEDEWQSRMEELGDKVTKTDVNVFPDKIIGIIHYTEIKKTIDSVADEYHLEGIRFLCKHCPHLDDPGDKRRKHCTCKYAELGTTHKEHEACEMFYKQLKQGKITPVEDYKR